MSEDKNNEKKMGLLKRLIDKVVPERHEWATDSHTDYYSDARKRMRGNLRAKMVDKTFKITSGYGNEMWTNKVNVAIAAMHKEKTAFILHQKANYIFFDRTDHQSSYVGVNQLRLSDYVLMDKWWLIHYET